MKKSQKRKIYVVSTFEDEIWPATSYTWVKSICCLRIISREVPGLSRCLIFLKVTRKQFPNHQNTSPFNGTPQIPLDKIQKFNRLKSSRSACILHQFFKIFGGGLCCPLDPSYTRKKPNSSHIIPCKLPNHIPCTTGLSWQKWNLKKKKIPTSNRLWTDSECIICISVFSNKKREEPPPPPRERKKSPASWRSELWRQKLHTIFFFGGGGVDTNSAKMGSECTICICFSKIFSGRPEPPPLRPTARR